MDIDWTQTPNGLRMLALRAFFRRHVFRRAWISVVNQHAGPGWDTVAALQRVDAECRLYLETLCALGYLVTEDGERYYETDAGRAFASASPRRYRRVAARRQLADLLRRCLQLNASAPSLERPETLVRVQALRVFGEYVSKTDPLDEVNVFFELEVSDAALYAHYMASLGSDRQRVFRDEPRACALRHLLAGLASLSPELRLPPNSRVISLIEEGCLVQSLLKPLLAARRGV